MDYTYEWIHPNPNQLQNSIKLIEKSIKSEKKDSIFFKWLIENIPVSQLLPKETKKIQGIIESIRDDELCHNQMYKKMYYQITGVKIQPEEETFIPPAGFKDGIADAMIRELDDVKICRQIMEGLPSLYYRDQVFCILSDELRHGNLYNYIYMVVSVI